MCNLVTGKRKQAKERFEIPTSVGGMYVSNPFKDLVYFDWIPRTGNASLGATKSKCQRADRGTPI